MARDWPSNVTGQFRRFLQQQRISADGWWKMRPTQRHQFRQAYQRGDYKIENGVAVKKGTGQKGLGNVALAGGYAAIGQVGTAKRALESGKEDDKGAAQKAKQAGYFHVASTNEAFHQYKMGGGKLGPETWYQTVYKNKNSAQGYAKTHRNGITRIREVGGPFADQVIAEVKKLGIGPYDPRIENYVLRAKNLNLQDIGDRTGIGADASRDILTHRGSVPKEGEGFVGSDWGNTTGKPEDRSRFRSMGWLMGQGYEWTPTQIKDLQSKLIAAGFLDQGDDSGHYDSPTIGAYHDMLELAMRQGKTPSEILAEYKGTKGAGTKHTPFTPPPRTKTSAKDLKQIAVQVAQSMTGETPSEAELNRIISQFRSGEENEYQGKVAAAKQDYMASEYHQAPGGAATINQAPSAESISTELFNKSEEGLNWAVLQGIQKLIQSV